ncbi:protoporphyrinogen oxidase HemJ [Sulfurimonas sp.]|jgi:putative membrane protein|uniref:protoporphyrinogen oxidase HemJ n=1 Tax=Sulfurimonas sp. TaxID=2022749 RepID=UPI0025F7D10A|nr:protoporphyrinogen oxidase HemJ [Sulfurimonas sp.]MCK9472924.1 protoporphyrinogen oxidase HemJ [Sulfurimonas sp.]MDD3505024.1 protoporphyrinogen oxidase HemJ [Sulfurimonas sp.]
MYNWVVWFHVLSFISWYAVLFYMPRLFVYHAENIENEGFIKVVKVMEMKIYKYIGIPAMWATVLSGTYLAYEFGFSGNGWLHAKIFFVLVLIAYFFSLGFFRVKFLNDECTKSGKFFRAYNEVPTILLLIIVAMVVIKPF